MTFQIRNFRPQEFDIVNDWANKEGFNKGLYDHFAFQIPDKEGFWIGILDGKPIASCSAVQYDQNVAFVSLYLVLPQYRGKGYGMKMWNKALQRITAKTMILKGVASQQQNYIKSGFKTYDTICRHEVNGTNKKLNSPNLINCQQVDFEKLYLYDRQYFPAERKEFLKTWIVLPQSHSLAFVKDGEIKGYGVLRKLFKGYKLGPLFADSYEVAKQLFQNFRGFISEDQMVIMDIPFINKNSLKLAQQFQMKITAQYPRMYTNQMPNLPYERTVYGLTSV